MAEETGLVGSLHSSDRAAWTKFHEALGTPDVLTTLVGESAEAFDRTRLRHLLDDVIRTAQLPGDHDEAGGGRVLSAVTARNL